VIDDEEDEGLTHEEAPFEPAPFEIRGEWDPGTFIENLAPAPYGGWFVTVPSHHRVDRVEPSGAHRVFADVPDSPTGIVSTREAALVLTGTIGENNWQVVGFDARGTVREAHALPELRFGNGMERAGEKLLIADSVQGLILSLDPRDGSRHPVIQHDLLTGPSPDVPIPGANGVALHNGSVYVSNTGRGLLLRVPLNGAPEPEIVAEHLVADDLDIDQDGRVYLATHYLNSVLRLDPDGTRTNIAGPDQGIVGSTSVLIDRRASGALYATTTGGMLGLDQNDGTPARLVRITI
jgi:hypothetical protein